MEDDDDLAAVGAFSSHIKSGTKSLGTYDQMMKKILKTEAEKYQKSGKMNRALSDALRYQHKLTLAQKSADLVTQHLKMREAMKKSTDSLSLFTGYLASPVSPLTIFKKMSKSISDSISMFDRLKQVQKDLLDIEKKHGKTPTDPIARNQKTKLEKEEAELKAKGAGKDENRGLMDRLSGAKEFFNKHKMGILIGGASAGILLAVLKKAFDVSPMFQAIKKLLNFGFMLILRPIGDFFGFIMRPIMVMMLRKFIIPWYKDVYPIMKKLGTWIGNQVAPAVEATANFLSTGGGQATAIATTAATAGVIIANKKGLFKGIGGSGKGAVLGAGNKGIIGSAGKTPNALQRIVNVLKSPANIIKNITGGVGKILQPLTRGAGVLNLASKAPLVLGNAVKNLKGMSGAAVNAVKGAGNIVNKVVGGLGKSISGIKLSGVNPAKMLTKVGRGGGLAGLAMVAEGMFASPETLGGVIDKDSPHRLDKGLAWLLSGGKENLKGFSEDAQGNFNTIGYGNELADLMGDKSYEEGFINKIFSGGGTGGRQNVNRGTGVTINIANVSKEVDVQHLGDVVSQELAKQNKKTSRF